MTDELPPSRPRRGPSVAARVLWSYVVILVAFALATGWGFRALGTAAKEARLVRTGYLPLALTLGELVAQQDLYNTQLNHITSARNPSDIRVWFDYARKGIPRKFEEVRARIASSFGSAEDEPTRRLGQDLSRETEAVERALDAGSEQLKELFELLDRREIAEAEARRDGLARNGLNAKSDLLRLKTRVEHEVDRLHREALERESRAGQILLALFVLTLAVGIAMALYAQRVLRPLAQVTLRANSVARGDLTPHPVLQSHDEIGELSQTFEKMVAAIAEANQKLLASERLVTIGKMAAHVTHEVRNPLSSIALNLELLSEEVRAENREARLLVMAVSKEVDRLTALSEQYLSMARKGPPNLQPEDLGAILQEAASFSERELSQGGVRVKLEVEGDLPLALADEAQIRQALLNLIRNAREAMPSGGTLSLKAVKVLEGVELSVEDEGAGIPEGVRERLFEPFFTTKGRGTGLGLSVVQQIVTAHSANIQCEDVDPHGTRFRIRFPLAKSTEIARPASNADQFSAERATGS